MMLPLLCFTAVMVFQGSKLPPFSFVGPSHKWRTTTELHKQKRWVKTLNPRMHSINPKGEKSLSLFCKCVQGLLLQNTRASIPSFIYCSMILCYIGLVLTGQYLTD
ncbi:hypothetical protein AMECASPLE_039228 [Ameca splendens]|uniref:Uncharacterized protein n=1 Tax=Ameca splendens TaxID=208324 RepID=A0ABV0YVH9_9TELE